MPEIIAPPDKHVFSSYGIWLYQERSSVIKRIKKQVSPSVHGDKHWDSSYLLMDYFTTNLLKRKSRVLDVGCGWGPTSIYLASKGHLVTGLDVDADVFPFLQVQAELNAVKVTTRQGAMSTMKKADLTHFDIIVGGDICFWDELADEWFAMLRRAASSGVKKLILADPGRSPFFDLANRCIKHWEVELLDWYSLEPTRFTGTLLIVHLNAN